jgi:hydrogenase-4 component B
MHSLLGISMIAIFLSCAGGMLLSPFAGRRGAPLVIAIVGAISSLLMVFASADALLTGQGYGATFWTIDGFGQLSLRVDSLSAVFLFTAGIVYLPISLFVRDFIVRRLHVDYPAHRFGVLYFALMASVALILVAGDTLLFLLAWECMSVLCYLLINFEPEPQSDKRAGYIMLAMSEAGFLAVVVAFLLLGRTASDLSFPALSAAGTTLSSTGLWSVFLLGFFGFGVKAGLVPVNLWLPRSYTAAPSVFIPVFAGVTLNLGFYGILRLDADLVHTGIGTGVLALIVGSITALVGILYATTENDMKTMLGHSSIENAGIVVAGVGAFLIYRASAHPTAAALALSASLYHMLNHSIYKTLLFQSAAYVEAETGTRDMNQLGGLSRLLPGLSIVFLVGCLAISAVPPFNGFVSEWLSLQALLRSAIIPSTSIRIVFALCGAVLALTAALAVTCFVKAYAMNFLGTRRGAWEPRRHEHNGTGFSPVFLAVVCLLLGTLPTYVLPLLNPAVEPLAGASATTTLVPPFFTATEQNGQLPTAFLHDFHNLGAQSGKGLLPGNGLVVLLRGGEQNPVVFAMSPTYSLIALAILILLVWFVVTWLTRKRSVERHALWAGGIPRLLPQMTYTATGFSNPVRVVFQSIFQPNITEDTRQTVAVHFRTAIHRQREETHVVDRIFLKPVGASVRWIADFLARMHDGRLNAYVMYVLGFLLLILFLYRAM